MLYVSRFDKHVESNLFIILSYFIYRIPVPITYTETRNETLCKKKALALVFQQIRAVKMLKIFFFILRWILGKIRITK